MWRFENHENKKGIAMVSLVGNVGDYKKEKKWADANGFKYYSADERARWGYEPKAVWSNSVDRLKKAHPDTYFALLKKMDTKAEPKAQPEYSLEDLLAMRATLNKAIAQKRKSSK